MPADFDDLFISRFAAVVRALVVLGADRSAAEDVAQDAFLVALREWEKVGRMDRPAAWVAKTAVYKWRQVRRTAVRRQELSRQAGPLPGSYQGQPCEEVERRSDLVNGLLGLTERQREVLVLHYFLDQTVGEVAQTLGIAPGTVKSTLHEARGALAKILQAGYADEFKKGGGVNE
ncbi:RNA polymerase sigma factor [Streptomyces luteogriseus]|uniref:RNA polymerase sigma factor n=1 Tax=Streptomyces luteogriseus TaxID=68233 RepID=UPI003797E924